MYVCNTHVHIEETTQCLWLPQRDLWPHTGAAFAVPCVQRELVGTTGPVQG